MLICLIFAKAIPRSLPIAVWNADNSHLSRMLIRNIETLPSCKVKYYITDLHEGKKLIVEGKAYAVLVIPKNFQRDIYRLKQPKLVFYYNNQRLLIGGMISNDILVIMKTMLVGIDAKLRSSAEKIPFKVAVQQANRITILEHIRSNPYFNYMYLLALPAIGHILQISMILTIIWAIGIEFKFGKTKEWLKAANNSITIAILGKLTPYAIIFFLVFAIIFLIYFVFYQSPYTGSVVVGLLGTIVFILAAFSIGIIFISLNGNFRYCLSAAAFYSAIGFALASISFPTLAMPPVIRLYAATMPLTYWTQIITDQSIRKIPVIYDFKHFLVLVIVILIACIMLYRLKLLANDENRWYQS